MIAAQTIPDLLYDCAQRWPDRLLVTFEDGSTWTYLQALAEGSRAASRLLAGGLRRGDRVLVMLPNGADWLRAWWGNALAGGVLAPVNPAYRGQVLAGVCDTAGPAVIVAGAEQVARLADRHRRLVLPPGELADGSPTVPSLDPPAQPHDPHCLLMTSGTTGPSKASITTHASIFHFDEFLLEGTGMSERDVFLADMPLFHVSALDPTIQMMRIGARVELRAAPDLADYWGTAKATGATYSLAPGTIAQLLEARPAGPGDRDHRMRFVLCSPLPADPAGFAARFGLQGVTTAYGSSEANIPIVNMLDVPVRPGSCGKLRHGFEARLVDDFDREVPPGEVGEFIVRTTEPWLQSQGYLGDPAATVRAWRNAWFHTGDALRRDGDGYYYFHDRYKDCLRRRGENISSFEVEADVRAYPGVAEAACVGHPGEVAGDDEVKVFVVPEPDAQLAPEKLVTFLIERMPHFMVPRFVEIVDELPKTASLRVRKYELRALGNSAATWDRKAAGLRIPRPGPTEESG